MNQYTVSFFGHRQINNVGRLMEELEIILKKLLNEKEYVEFLVGRNGEFDKLVSSIIKSLKKNFRDDNSCHTLILPYDTSEYRDNFYVFSEYYDNIEIFDSLQKFHYKSVITERNKDMIDRSDLIIFYIEQKSGGAYKTYKYACSQNKNILILNH